jgi:DNA-binding transcriptional LysR family regulator
MGPTALPPLHALHCFDVAARAGSFSAAAREMSLTHGAISRQIRLLEGALGGPLFLRGARRLTLTAEGELLAAATARAFAALREGLAGLDRRRGGPLVLSCEPTLLLEWLLPRWGRFQEAHPGLTFRLDASGGAPATGGIDLAIRRQDFPVDPALDCVPLMEEWMGPVCSPACAETLAGRAPLTRLVTRTRPAAFPDWLRATRGSLRAGPELAFDHFAWSLQAAVAGLGLAMGPYPLVADALAAGRLVAPFGFVRGEVGYVLLSAASRAGEPALAALRSWLKGQARGMRPAAALRSPAPAAAPRR